ncbi:peptide deformylase [Pontibacillus yanchengensis]|uniref:Peptide deformylase n=2 Tax=Pontibacillus yanchengensis TaxID=462910 RepID=A0ACC7VB97_9BACI|nr:peptide deformylase [Pontibacillus yanchengensis]MYL32969.1 peptide deformylase [Pontibacillus yanchengensis]MYL52181.1 peptide deformylase [Pontibacillus yanchengensis]
MLTMDAIVREGHPVLREVANEVPLPPSEKDLATLENMLQFIKNSQDEQIAEEYNLRPGVGLAAPQINVSKRMLAVHFVDFEDKQYSYGLINPKIVSHSVEKTYLTSGEGCLSVDRDVPGYVPRYARITVKGTDLDGNEVKLRLRGFAAIVFQHEIDHLNGIMFYDHINKDNPFKEPENATPADE